MKNFFSALALAITMQCSILMVGCNEVYQHPVQLQSLRSSVLQSTGLMDSALIIPIEQPPLYNKIFTKNTDPNQVVAFAHTQMGVPYVYAATDPAVGFDCSGFITYVFNHFGILVPRASASFTHIEKSISLQEARPGDLILFTGTDTSIHEVGHMGIIESVANGQVSFIHASSGKAMGVTISPLDAYYKSRFVKLIRVF